MLFNSYAFIFGFLPLVLCVYAWLSKSAFRRAAQTWLVLSSFFFYAYWDPKYLLLLVAILSVNFGLGRLLHRKQQQPLLVLGIAANLLVLGYFKYLNFFADNWDQIFGTTWVVRKIVLPLGLSFHTFQQIAYLVDSRRRATVEHSFSDYCLFVCFFPQLLAGPIVRDNEMLSQFHGRVFRLRSEDLALGTSMFLVGLFKKVALADNVTPFANRVFAAADAGQSLHFVDAWIGALAYTMQIYFDFSGYSDMALGLGRMFGIVLPQNFNSPYQARNISDFWRRWHMTLSRFLRDYLYIPLGGNRHGPLRRYANLMLTMLLGGLWHGAGWNFLIWGGLHGAYLVVHQMFGKLRARAGAAPPRMSAGPFVPADTDRAGLGQHAGAALTFVCVVCAWVFFRAETFGGARAVLASMFGADGFHVATTLNVKREALAWLFPLAAICYALPNTQQIFAAYRPVLGPVEPASLPIMRLSAIAFRPTLAWACFAVTIGLVSLWQLSKVSEFIYFQF
jgi:alginate O-acetyltransferase complex protein AlgI